MGLRATAHPFALMPSWLGVMHSSWEEQWAALNDPSFQSRLLTEDPIHLGEFEAFVTSSFDKMFPSPRGMNRPHSKVSQPWRDQQGRTCREVALELLLRNEGLGQLYFPLFNYAEGGLDVLRELHAHKDTLMGLSDDGAHCGAICDGGMPTFMLTHWSRDRSRGEKLPLEWIIHIGRRCRQHRPMDYSTEDSSHRVFAQTSISLISINSPLQQPKMNWDLPAGGRRLVQRATGYRATICHGEFIRENDQYTDALPGRLIRGRTQAPVSA